jgi:hypothetical protein
MFWAVVGFSTGVLMGGVWGLFLVSCLFFLTKARRVREIPEYQLPPFWTPPPSSQRPVFLRGQLG